MLFEVVDKVFSLGKLFLFRLIEDRFLFEVYGRESFILKGLVDFVAQIFPDEGLIGFLIEELTVVFGEIVEDVAVMRLFVLVFDVREYLRAFLGGDGNILLLLENALDFLVLKLLFALVKSVHEIGDTLDMHFGVVFVKLVILYNGFIFVFIFLQIVKPPHELFFLIGHSHFFVKDGFRANLVVEDVIDMGEVVDALGVQVLVVQCVIDEDRHGGLLA